MYSQKEFKTMGVTAPASYVIYSGDIDQNYNSVLSAADISKGDRIVYADGEVIYSASQLSEVIEKDISLVTVDRDGKWLSCPP